MYFFPKTDKKLVSYDFVYENFRLDHFDSIFNPFLKNQHFLTKQNTLKEQMGTVEISIPAKYSYLLLILQIHSRKEENIESERFYYFRLWQAQLWCSNRLIMT